MWIRRGTFLSALAIVTVAMSGTYTLNALQPEALWHWPGRLFVLPILQSLFLVFGLRGGPNGTEQPYDPIIVFLLALLTWSVLIEGVRRLWTRCNAPEAHSS